MTVKNSAQIVPIIPAGGSGTRLWPLSLPEHPKFLLDLFGSGRSLLQTTVARVEPVAAKKPIIVTGRKHEDAVIKQVGASAQVIAEPTPRNSMPAIAVAAAVAELEDKDAVIASFAADHFIRDEAGFCAAVTVAAEAARKEDVLVTLGITPDEPSTGFGYIETGIVPEGIQQPTALEVVRFVEKPDEQRAKEFFESGSFLWNAGMFVVRARVLLDQLQQRIPVIAEGARAIAAARGEAEEAAAWEQWWEKLTSIAIDHALAEPMAAEGLVRVVPASIGWEDVGDFASLSSLVKDLREQEAGIEAATGVVDLGDNQILAADSTAYVYGKADKPVALVGLDEVSVVFTDHAILIAANDSAQKVGDVAKAARNLAH